MSSAEVTIFLVWGLFLTAAIGRMLYANHIRDTRIGDRLESLRAYLDRTDHDPVSVDEILERFAAAAPPAGVEPEETTLKDEPGDDEPTRLHSRAAVGAEPGILVHVQRLDGSPLSDRPRVPRPDSKRGPTTRPPSVPAPPPIDPQVEELAGRMIAAAHLRGENVSHCARSTECLSGGSGSIMICPCSCEGCARRAEVYRDAYRQIHGAGGASVGAVGAVCLALTMVGCQNGNFPWFNETDAPPGPPSVCVTDPPALCGAICIVLPSDPDVPTAPATPQITSQCDTEDGPNVVQFINDVQTLLTCVSGTVVNEYWVAQQ
jgi:hypothetical protein